MLLRSAIKQCFRDTPHQCSLWFPQFDQQRRGIWPPKEKREKCTNLNTVKSSSIWKQAHHTTIILGSVWSRNFHRSAQFVLWDGLWVKGGAERIVHLQECASRGVVAMARIGKDRGSLRQYRVKGIKVWMDGNVNTINDCVKTMAWTRQRRYTFTSNTKNQKCLARINDSVLPFWPKFPSVIIVCSDHYKDPALCVELQLVKV